MDQYEEPPFSRAYEQSVSNETIQFGSRSVRLSINGNEIETTVDGELAFRVRPDFRFRAGWDQATPEILELLRGDSKAKLTLDEGVYVDVFVQEATSTLSRCDAVLSPYQSAVRVTPPKELEYAVFHLLNFPAFSSEKDFIQRTPSGGVARRSRVTFDLGDWHVTLLDDNDSENRRKELKKRGGYAITTVGRVAKRDGRSFSVEELDEVLVAVHQFLSLATGRWSGLSLPVGYDVNDEVASEEWGTRFVCAGLPTAGLSCFDGRRGEILSEVSMGFARLRMRRAWRDRFHELIWWYVCANDRGPSMSTDMAIVPAQAAFELIAWVHCVVDRKMVSKRAFGQRGLLASDKLRLLASSLNLPLDIPAELKTLHSKGTRFEDVPHAITELRNAVVHPDKRGYQLSDVAYDGWRLCMWYLDLAILALCGHEGDYSNRLKTRLAGDVERVPWAAEEREDGWQRTRRSALAERLEPPA